MSENVQMWMEVAFNVLYLITVWGLVIAMIGKRANLPPGKRKIGRYFIWAFALLALGDTGHVGFRVLAYLSGDLETMITLFGVRLGLVGLGALSTAVTVTFFYVLMAMIWHERYGKPYRGWDYLLFGAAAVRLLLMALPQNAWNRTVPPQPWSLYRNLPLIVQGLGVAYLILRDAIAQEDHLFQWIGVLILVSYLFYLPVILFVQMVPLLGMLMIPKTLAYIGIAILGYTRLFSSTPSQDEAAA